MVPTVLYLSACLLISPADLQERKDVDQDGVPWPLDCDDRDAGVQGPVLWFPDQDQDGYGDLNQPSALSCSPLEEGQVSQGGDCDDSDHRVNPAMPETCEPGDEDCDGQEGDQDPGGVTGTSLWYPDQDGDGYGPSEQEVRACSPPDERWVLYGGDCDDADPDLNPETVWYLDADEDSYGDPDHLEVCCVGPPGYVRRGGDCDDSDADVSPEAPEVCGDGVDNDCSGDGSGCGLGQGLSTADEVGERILGPDHGSYFGFATAGDMDGEGLPEVVVGASGYSPDGDERGAVWIFTSPVVGQELADASVVLLGEPGDWLGQALDASADLDGDGHSDLILGTPYGQDSVGTAYLRYGPHPTSAAALEIGDVADAVFSGDGPGLGADSFAFETRFTGDLDGDGLPELAIGAYRDDLGGEDSGSLYLWYGSSQRLEGSLSCLDADAIWTGSEPSELAASGRAVGGALDVDGDGLAEILVSSLRGEDGGGRVYLVYGTETRQTGVHSFADADATLTGPSEGSRFGDVVHALGDVDGDGYGEWATVSQGSDALITGWVFSGSASPWEGSLSASLSSSVQYTSSDGAWALAWAVGDLDGDGSKDMAVGAGYMSEVESAAGGVVVYYAPSLSGSWDAEDGDVTIVGTVVGEQLGLSVISAVDLQGDGYDDLLVDAVFGDFSRGSVVFLLGGAP